MTSVFGAVLLNPKSVPIDNFKKERSLAAKREANIIQ